MKADDGWFLVQGGLLGGGACPSAWQNQEKQGLVSNLIPLPEALGFKKCDSNPRMLLPYLRMGLSPVNSEVL